MAVRDERTLADGDVAAEGHVPDRGAEPVADVGQDRHLVFVEEDAEPEEEDRQQWHAEEDERGADARLLPVLLERLVRGFFRVAMVLVRVVGAL